MTNDRPRAHNSTLPARTHYMTRTPFPARSGQAPRAATRRAPGGLIVTVSTIPPGVLAAVDARDGHFCVHCGRWREVIEHHHRRIKGMGGSIAPHTECPCCIVSLCPWWSDSACHPWAHRNREEAEAEGLVISRSVTKPWTESVLVRTADGGLLRFPACDGTWQDCPQEVAA